MPLSSHRQFDQALAFAAQSVERTMDRLLPSGDEGEARLFEAMRYSSLGGGKRLRAFFVLALAPEVYAPFVAWRPPIMIARPPRPRPHP